MALEGGVPVNRAEALDIMNLVKSPENQKHVKQLSQTERRVVAAMLVALRNGREVKAPSPQILANIRTKLEGVAPEKTGRQKAAQLVKSAWFGVFGVKPRYSSKSLCDEASEVSRQIEGKEAAAKFTGTRAFQTACADMKNFFQTLKEDYQIPPLVAMQKAMVYKQELQAKVENNNTSLMEKAFIRQYQLPAVEAQLILLEAPKNWNTLNSSHWDKQILDWKPGRMKDLIDQKAGFVQQPTSAQRVEWFVGRAQFGELQELMKNMYVKAAQPEANHAEIFRETEVKLDRQIEHASKQAGLEYRSYLDVLKILRGEVLEAVRSGVDASRLEDRLVAWDTMASAGSHVLNRGRPRITANNDII